MRCAAVNKEMEGVERQERLLFWMEGRKGVVAEGGKRTQLAMLKGDGRTDGIGNNEKGESPDSIPITLLDDYHSMRQRMERRRQREEEKGAV